MFVYDSMPIHSLKRKLYKFKAKKILRLLGPKYCSIVMGHRAVVYRLLGHFLSKSMLENQLQGIVHQANNSKSPYLGYGYDCVNSNLVTHEDIYPLKGVRFETAEFNIVNRADVILTQLYGDYLSLPPEHQRIMRHCRELIPDISDDLHGVI